MISFSDAATQEILRLQARQENPNSVLRLQVQSGGCLGMYYAMGFEDQREADDPIYTCGKVQVVLDANSASYLNGLTLDYSEDLMGGGFRFQNPNVSQSCSCGNSFAPPSSPA